LVVLCVIMVSIGLYPALMVPLVSSGVTHILHLVGGA